MQAVIAVALFAVTPLLAMYLDRPPNGLAAMFGNQNAQTSIVSSRACWTSNV